jgi:hypothetical protein
MDRLLGLLKASPKLFCEEMRCPVLDPERGKTKAGATCGRSRATIAGGAARTRQPPSTATRPAAGPSTL